MKIGWSLNKLTGKKHYISVEFIERGGRWRSWYSWFPGLCRSIDWGKWSELEEINPAFIQLETEELCKNCLRNLRKRLKNGQTNRR